MRKLENISGKCFPSYQTHPATKNPKVTNFVEDKRAWESVNWLLVMRDLIFFVAETEEIGTAIVVVVVEHTF